MLEHAAFETKTERIYRLLRSEIVDGTLAEGQRLRLSTLAARLSTSEMPVREALRMLQRDGLVEMESHRGAMVAHMDRARVLETVLVRMHLEMLAVAEATPYHDDASLAEARSVLAAMDDALTDGDLALFSEANRRFHSALYEPCPHSLLKREIQHLWDHVWRTRWRSLFRLDPKRGIRAQEEHRSIVAAVAAGDPGAAARASQEHRDRTVAAWRNVLWHEVPAAATDDAGSP